MCPVRRKKQVDEECQNRGAHEAVEERHCPGFNVAAQAGAYDKVCTLLRASEESIALAKIICVISIAVNHKFPTRHGDPRLQRCPVAPPTAMDDFSAGARGNLARSIRTAVIDNENLHCSIKRVSQTGDRAYDLTNGSGLV